MEFLKLVAKRDIFNTQENIKIFTLDQNYLARKIGDKYLLTQDMIVKEFQLFELDFILENFNIIDKLT